MQEQQSGGAVNQEAETTKKGWLRRSGEAASGKKKRKKGRVLLAMVLLLAAALGIFRYFGGRSGRDNAAGAYIHVTADRGDITVSLSGNGTLEPADSYVVTTLVSGEILDASFEEGDKVEKDQVLYQVDSSDLSNSIERAELALNQSQTNYIRRQEALEDLSVKASVSGTVMELLVEAGDEVTAGQTLARIIDRDTMKLVVPFPADDAVNISAGQSARIVLDGTFEELSGTVTKVSGADQILPGNRIVRNVTIEVPNPGAITNASSATASVGEYSCTASAVFSYRNEGVIAAPAAGDVVDVAVSEGAKVSKNSVLLTIDSNTVADTAQSAYTSLRDAEIALENQYDQLENYTIKSPIRGTVVEKNYKAGDNLEGSKVLCTIYDLSYLTMTLYVDELDISQMSVGQSVTITADAVEGKTYEGVVTTVSIKGTTVGGVTTYPVTIRIDQTEGLLPGMNVDCDIQIESVAGVVRIPAAAVERGNRLLVRTGEVTGEMDYEAGIPVGFTYRQVEIGASDGEMAEVISGLEEGDVVAYLPATSNTFMNMIMTGTMPGMGAPGGAMGGPGR